VPAVRLPTTAPQGGDISGVPPAGISDHVYVKHIDCQSGFTPRAVSGRLHSVNADCPVADFRWQSLGRSCDQGMAAPATGWAGFIRGQGGRGESPGYVQNWLNTPVRSGRRNCYGTSPWRLLIEGSGTC